MTSATPPADGEVFLDTFMFPFGPTFTDDEGTRCTVVMTAADCDDESCQRCYQPLMLSIDPVEGGGHCGSHPALQLDVVEGWEQVDRLIAALTAARARQRSA